MPERRSVLSPALERKLAAELFNRTWDLLSLKHRTKAEDELMVHCVHASCYHWGRVGKPLNFSIGEWQASRVYAVLRRPEPALFHAKRCLEITRRGRLGRFYLAYAHEAMARACALAHRTKERDRHLRSARRVGARIADADDRRMLLEDLATVR
jgi:hypothetical protein